VARTQAVILFVSLNDNYAATIDFIVINLTYNTGSSMPV